ncbi:MAG: NAD(P)-binding domain-containing protein [Thaumarchaeota archaeon]|nr:NAD(P)-binding domain-containing protein [Nitrososphaerota archaeon]
MRVAILGGTGAMGTGLAKHLSKKNEVIIGSRDERRAGDAASRIEGAVGMGYEAASRAAELAVFAVPYSAIGEAARLSGALSGKVAVSMVNPLKAEGGLLKFALAEGSAAQELAAALPESKVATAFNHISSLFFERETMVPMDVLVAADARGTYEEVAALVTSIPNLRPLYAGPLSEARTIEMITPLLLNLAKMNKTGSLAMKFATTRDPAR